MESLRSGQSKEITVLWITAGLGCDGESVALTAATQPSIEDIVMMVDTNSPEKVVTE